ncbi:hypothetical protein Salat_1202900 [Sesamum alatum]|uniref:AT-hook motif nuclear-localized protein n=1 Tax=Sesamum alatum TaxID=300844 RepID=A0AAE1YF72_9LAMI|nr:hypothetical protein Salat_1202900 [Sesamum alatum]
MEVENAVSQHATTVAAAEEPKVLEVSTDEVEMVVGTDEDKLENEGGEHEQRGAAVSVARSGEAVFVPKRKRGRPRKQRPGEAQGEQFIAVPASSPMPEKRGRGRPRGSGKWQILGASSGNFVLLN